MRKSSKTVVFSALFIFIATVLYSQPSIEEVEDMSKQYTDEIFVNLKINKQYKIEIDKDKLVGTIEKYSEILVLNNIMATNHKEEVYYNSQSELVDLSAWTYYNDDGKYRKEKVIEFSDKKDMDSKVFHDDSRMKIFTFPKVKKGSIKCMEEVYKLDKIEFMEAALMASSAPILEYVVSMEIDKDISITPLLYNIDSGDYTYTVEEKRKTLTYTWTFHKVKKLTEESSSPGILHYAPHIKFRVDKYNDSKGNSIPVLQSVEDLYNFNYGYINGLKKCEPSIESKVDSLVKNTTQEYEKVKNIYYWVKQNVKYIAFEAGDQGFIPRDVNDIYEKKYGDCKDMSNIIHKMCNYAKIDSVYLAWIGTDKIPYKINELWLPSLFNHMIAIWKKNGVNYVLDATDNNTPMYLPSMFVQEKEAMLSIDKDNFEIIKIPSVSASQNKLQNKIAIKIVNDTLKGTGISVLSNYIKTDYLRMMYGVNNSTKERILRNYLELGNNNFILSDYKEVNADNIDSPLTIHYSFYIPKMTIKLDSEYIFNPYLKKLVFPKYLDSTRKTDYKMDYKFTVESTIQVALNQGDIILENPQNISLKEDKYEFESTSTIDKDNYTLQYNYINSFILLNKADFSHYKTFIKKIEEALSENVSLKSQ